MEKNIDIAIIGSKDSIFLFNAIGIRTYITSTPFEADKKILELVNNNCKIIYLTEDVYLSIPETIEKYKSNSFPIIIPLPVGEENLNVGRNKIRQNVEKAIGIDIF